SNLSLTILVQSLNDEVRVHPYSDAPARIPPGGHLVGPSSCRGKGPHYRAGRCQFWPNRWNGRPRNRAKPVCLQLKPNRSLRGDGEWKRVGRLLYAFVGFGRAAL